MTGPTQTPEDHAVLKEARRLATALVGSDATNVPLVHPIRWPGSGHRNAAPRMARIVALNNGAEVELQEALQEAAGPAGATETGGAKAAASGPRIDTGGSFTSKTPEDHACLIAELSIDTKKNAAVRDIAASLAAQGCNERFVEGFIRHHCPVLGSGRREQHPHRLCQVSQGQDAADAEGTGDAIALAFTAAHGEGLRYEHVAGRWYRWEGDHWKAGATGRTCSCCRTLSRTASADAADKVKATPARRASPFSQAQRVARNTHASAETRSTDDQHAKCQ